MVGVNWLQNPNHVVYGRPEELLPYLWSDKKRLGEELTVVLPQRIGCCTLRKMTRPQLLQLLREGL